MLQTERIVLIVIVAALVVRNANGQWPNAVVAADHEAASEAGVEIMRRGGNIVDAAVATSFALAVVRPSSCGLGGGGFMMVYFADRQEAVAIDYRETAPIKSTSTMFLSDEASSRRGGLSVGMPGTVAGLYCAHKRFGKLEWAEILEPAIDLARNGYSADEHTVRSQSAMVDYLRRERKKDVFAALWKLHLENGRAVSRGEVVGSPLLAVLKRVQADGPDGFYSGDVAKSLMKTVNKHGGIWTADDFVQEGRVVCREPIKAKFDGLTLYSMPPPSSGGVALAESLNIIGEYETQNAGFHISNDSTGSAREVHIIAETLKHAFADRARYLGDPDHQSIETGKLLGQDYASSLAKRIETNRTRGLKAYGSHFINDDSGTSHFSIIDRSGNAIACTETINGSFGSLLVDDQFGIVLNNEMDDFSTQPGKPNMFGLMQSEINRVEPRKRPLSSMMPTITVDNGKAVSAFGASGGPRIISACLQVFLNVHRKEMSPEKALATPRIHHQWLPDRLVLPKEMESRSAELQSFGHKTTIGHDYSAVQVVVKQDDGQLTGASDPRKGGAARGF